MSVLPTEVISQFVKGTNDSSKSTNSVKSFYGTAVVNSSGIYVRLDGSEALTPVSMATDAKNNDRVLVTIEDHKASITNNITSPASGRSATDLYYVETNENGDVVVKGELRAAKEYVDELIAKNITVASIETQSAKIIMLEAQQANFENATAENFTAVRAEIENLVVGNLDAKYANIDLANVDTAKIRQGFMETLMVSQGIFTSDISAAEGTFTNYLTGVNILANNITAGTLSVERLIITGSGQSIVYEINKANGTPQLSQTTVDGGSLTERTVTADRIVAESITGNEIAATTITGQHIVGNTITADNLEANTITADSACIGSLNASKITTGTLSADRIDVNGLFAKNITATGTITGAKLVGATGSFTGSINATSGVFSCGNDYGQTVYVQDGHILMLDVESQVILDGNGLRVQSKGGHNYAYVAQDGIYTETELKVVGNVTCTDVIANGWAYVGQVHFKQNSSGNYISIGNYNNAWNNYYYAAGYHAFYCGGNGIAYIQSDGIRMNNFDIQFNIGHGIKYGSEWILRPYKSGDYNVTALGNGNRRTVLYGSQVRLNGANGTTVTSDRRLKKDFSTFDERHEKFFMNLTPATYRMAYEKNSDEYKRTNGFVAQDVESALINAGLKPEELDIISYDTVDQEYLNEMFNGHPPDIRKQYSLNYNNFISLNTYMIQKNRKELNYQSGRIDMQQAIINDLQSRLWQAEKEIKELKQAAQ
ncbi:MAG: tail fiber domain-containing protein [Clostridiales bacterium]|nr:tail fiber domain-containing protein [Clostridiales bacterium]